MAKKKRGKSKSNSSKKKKSGAKKKTSKKKSTRKKVTRSSKKSQTTIEVEKVMMENFVGLQKVLTNTSIKLSELTEKISKLLILFEEAAREVVEKGVDLSGKNTESEEKLNKQLDNLQEQNKLIARGLTLLNQNNPPQPSSGQYIPPQSPPLRNLNPPPSQQNQDIQENITQDYSQSNSPPGPPNTPQ